MGINWQYECQYYNAYTHYQGPVVPKHNHSTLLWFKYQSKINPSQAFLHSSVSFSLPTNIPQHMTEMLYGGIHTVSHLKGDQRNYTSRMFNLKRLHKNNEIQQHHPYVFLRILLKIPIQKNLIFFKCIPLIIFITSHKQQSGNNSWQTLKFFQFYYSHIMHTV